MGKMMSDLLNCAILFAAEKHSGQIRKLENIPFILHPLEVEVILSSLTDDENTLAAGILQDTLEDTDTSAQEIAEKFGRRVLELVSSETEDKQPGKPKAETWMNRKNSSLKELAQTDDLEVKKIWLADKLSNLRSFSRLQLIHGDHMWDMLNQKDKKKHEWYYRAIAECTAELKGTAAYTEYCTLIEFVFGGKDNG